MDMKLACEVRTGIPFQQQCCIFASKKLEDDRPLKFYGIRGGTMIHLGMRLSGGGGPSIPKIEMVVAAGGLIHQSIEKDTHSPSKWRPNDTITVNLQIVNSQVFQAITGASPPESPIDASTYASLGLPFFKLYDESPLSISGAFDKVKSIGNIDGYWDHYEHLHIIEVNPKGPKMEFRTLSDMMEQLSALASLDF
ncbi:MAG: hypothetical protein M1840_002139 [Geoglossum simile]|nr:MAG: hypothetical protein M1840_002139 [Geoglossum simile]